MRPPDILALLSVLSGIQAAPGRGIDDNSHVERDVSYGGGYVEGSTAGSDKLAADAWKNKLHHAWKHGFSDDPSCTPDNVIVRKDWSHLSKSERRDYIDAVLCLQSSPSLKDPIFLPGVQSRYDDFIAVHMNQTLTIHGTANFLAWHRWYIWNFERTIRSQCGYSGYLPYWNWPRYAYDPLNSPLFDGSEYSLSGQGDPEPHYCSDALGNGLNCIPPGTGGGCVRNGPFGNYTINLGPVQNVLRLVDPEPLKPVSNLFDYNPRCFRRDITSWISSNWTRDEDVTNLITRHDDIVSFESYMDGDFPAGFYGVHAAGHFTVNGDPGGDIFTSPGDPAFWLHHTQIDRVWWIWQYLKPEDRLLAYGGVTVLRDPSSPPGSLDDVLNMGNLGDTKVSRDVMDTTHGPFCYVYL